MGFFVVVFFFSLAAFLIIYINYYDPSICIATHCFYFTDASLLSGHMQTTKKYLTLNSWSCFLLFSIHTDRVV